ncbi:MAG: hypothetical protein HC895_00240 [Leptolyngbyaceae cyanobacterium SM1_3_5]|nr:hypothetical protein [Leptolyngbyaceae cyanobacterium SM1_3_5]
MPRPNRKNQPEPAPEFPTDVDFDFTPPQASENQPTPAPQSNVRPFPTLPTATRSPQLNLPEIEG